MLKAITILGYTAIILLAGLEMFTYSGIIFNYTNSPLLLISTPLLIYLFAIRLRSPKSEIPRLLPQLNNLLLLSISLITLALFLIEAFQFPNYIFSTFGINHFILVDLLLFTSLVKLILAPRTHLARYWPNYLLGIFLTTCLYISVYHLQTFINASLNASGDYDDNFMEWLQVIILLFGQLVLAAILFKNRTTKLQKAALFGVSLLLFFLAGEEISWGQRIFSIEAPAAHSNYQDELNLHNQPVFNELAKFLYYAAFIYALISWLIRRIALHKQNHSAQYQFWWHLLTLSGHTVLYFLPTAIFNPYADRAFWPGHPSALNLYDSWGLLPGFFQTLEFLALWRETFEVCFYAGIIIHLILLYQKLSIKVIGKATI